MFLERLKILKQSSSFITTIDHAPRIIEEKLQGMVHKKVFLPLLISDEVHILSTDTSFKLDTIRDYYIAEMKILDMGGIPLHVTATPENLHLSEYDLIIQIKQEDNVIPFKEAGYYILDKSTKNLKSQFLRMIRFTAESNQEKKLLIFLEDKDWIEDYCKKLQQYNINAIGIMAKRENNLNADEIKIIDKGKISGEIQVIFSTTVLSSGVSIVDNNEIDETWVLCSSNSMNHELTRLIQMSHRFRNKYQSFKIFFEKANSPKVKKAFLYHILLEEKIKKAEKSRELVNIIRRNSTDYYIQLGTLEQQSGLYSDQNGKLHVLTPMIQGELIQNKTYYNYKNQDVLVMN